MLSYIGAAFVPLFICAVLVTGLIKRKDVFSLFTKGAAEGFGVVLKIAPSLIGLLVAVGMLNASGVLDGLVRLLSPAAERIGFPAEVLPLVLLRPISGSGAVALLQSVLNGSGPDSFAGKVASVICGGSETTFYTIALYFGSAGIKKTRCAIPCGLLADLCVVIGAVIAVKLLM